MHPNAIEKGNSEIQIEPIFRLPEAIRGECRGRRYTRREARQDLEPLLQKIDKEVKGAFKPLHLLSLTAENTWNRARKHPFQAIGKGVVLGVIGYGMKNIIKGVISGEVIFRDIPLDQLWSGDKAVRINAGQFLTNAANNASFTMAGIWLLYGGYRLILREPYREALRGIVEQMYSSAMENSSLPLEQVNELYECMVRHLKNFGDICYNPNSINVPYPSISLENPPTCIEKEFIQRVQSKPLMRKALENILKEVREDIQENAAFPRLLWLTFKNWFEEIRENPFAAVGRLMILAGIGYMIKNIIEGIFSGEELFYDVSFYDVFSSNTTTSLNAAGYLTNAASDASFTLDGFFMLYVGYALFFQRAYHKAMQGIVNECYEKAWGRTSLSSDESDELYKIKSEEMDSYGGYAVIPRP